MKIGVPTEIKPQENRVAMTPAGVERLLQAGHAVHVQMGAGLCSGFSDEDYSTVGAKLEADAPAVFGTADMILKVKEPSKKLLINLKPGSISKVFLMKNTNKTYQDFHLTLPSSHLKVLLPTQMS